MMGGLFGTDGVRGRANAEPMTVETILLLGKAAAAVLRQGAGRHRNILIGKDTRVSGYMFETALAAGLCSMGVDVILVGPVPTPAVAFLTTAMRAEAGAVISASHNPYYDNGIKFFGSDGYKLSDEIEARIESCVRDAASLAGMLPDAKDVGKAKRLDDARGRYITYLKYNFPSDLTLKGVKIVVDCAQGATYKVAPSVFDELGADVTVVGAQPDGFNINEGCGALHPQGLAAKVRESGADIGIAFDGDGDRVVCVDQDGHVFDGDDFLGILAPELQRRGELGAGVVGTVMSNLGLARYFEERAIPFFRAQVGDRYVVDLMRQKGCAWGGEQSGHLIHLGRSTTGDGILSSLLLLSHLCGSGKRLSDFKGLVARFPQVIRNVKVREKKELSSMPGVQKAIREIETSLGKKGRVLVRYSGTEPKARVMIEGEDLPTVEKFADDIADAIDREVGIQG